MESGKGKLVNFANGRNLELIGMLFESETAYKNSIVVHVHGNYGNFYNNKFIWVMSKMYVNHEISFLSFNLSSHDGLAEGYRDGELDYIGGGVADYNESILDIHAAITYVRRLGYKEIYLQGHSLGCDKIIEYILINEASDIKVILLSPVDSYAVQKRWLELHRKEKVETQIKRLSSILNQENDNLEWLDISEYGAEGLNRDWIYKIPITRNALLSILTGAAFKYLNVMCGEDFYIKNDTFVFLGLRDGLQMISQKDMRVFLERHFENCFFEDTIDSDHDIIGVEEELVKRLCDWIINGK